MKYLFILFITILLVISAPAANTDVYNVGTVYDLNNTAIPSTGDACMYYIKGNQVFYTFRIMQMTDNGSDQIHSKPFYIGDCNASDGFVRGITSAGADVDVIYHFSYDNCNTWKATTAANLNALSNTAVGDTIGIEAGVNDATGFHAGTWMVIEIDEDGGGASYDSSETATITINLTLDGTLDPDKDVYLGRERIRNSSNTNP